MNLESYNKKSWIREYPASQLQTAEKRLVRVRNNRQTFSSGDGYFFLSKKIINVTTIEKAANSTALSCINKLIVSYMVIASPP